MRYLLVLPIFLVLMALAVGCSSEAPHSAPAAPDAEETSPVAGDPSPQAAPKEAEPVPAAASADERYAAILELQPPAVDQSRLSDPGYRQQYQQAYLQAIERQIPLTGAFLEEYPDDPRVPEVRDVRWRALASIGDTEAVLRETLAAAEGEEDDAAAAEALFLYVRVKAIESNWAAEEVLPAIDRFAERAPEDERIPQLLQVLSTRQRSPDQRLAIFRRLIDEFPESNAAAAARGELRRLEAVGEPFALEFTDAITGEEINLQEDLQGKAVVIDFWATWCGPCIASMPELKELYAEYGDRVEFIGVSLDHPEEAGGLEDLKQFVAKNEIPWPQYYQGNGWESEFSRSWGINAIPAMFIVGPDGKLVSTEARGQLQQLLAELVTDAPTEDDAGSSQGPAAAAQDASDSATEDVQETTPSTAEEGAPEADAA